MERTLADIIYDFHYGCTSGNLEKVRHTLNIDGLKEHNNAETYLYEGLGYAIGHNRDKIIEYLLSSNDFKQHVNYDANQLFPVICSNKKPEVIQVIINDMNQKNILIPYTQGFINACDKSNFPVLDLLLSQEDIRKKISTDIQLKKFEDAIKQDNLDLVKYYLHSKDLQFNIYCSHYLKRKKRGFDPFSTRIKISKPIDSYMSAFELQHQLRVNLPTPTTKKFLKI